MNGKANIILIFAMCYSLQDLKNVECKTWCKMNGYDSGAFQKKFCWCGNKITPDRIEDKKIGLPKKIRPKGFWE